MAHGEYLTHIFVDIAKDNRSDVSLATDRQECQESEAAYKGQVAEVHDQLSRAIMLDPGQQLILDLLHLFDLPHLGGMDLGDQLIAVAGKGYDWSKLPWA
jgi:hypothetical protein